MTLLTAAAPHDKQEGQLQSYVGATGNVWVVTFGPYGTKRQIKRVSMDPPGDATGSTVLKIFIESTRIATSPSGLATNWSPRLPIPLVAGTSLMVVWFVGTGTNPEAIMMSDLELL